MTRPHPRMTVWLILLAVGGTDELLEVRGHRTGTLTGFTRWIVCADTRAGRATFSWGWPLFAAWFWAHVRRHPRR